MREHEICGVQNRIFFYEPHTFRPVLAKSRQERHGAPSEKGDHNGSRYSNKAISYVSMTTNAYVTSILRIILSFAFPKTTT